MYNKAKKILKTVYGYDKFRPMQKEIIDNILKKNDTLVIMPTGGGKSICYQIPALLFSGLTIVVSPLISLMKDQIEQLNENGVNAIVLNSTLSRIEYSNNIYSILHGKVKLLYIAPETLLKQRILDLLSKIRVDCLAIDEAHCISEWGHDFRPEYRKLAEVRKQFKSAVCVALTATATPQVQKDISKSLKLEKSNEYITSFDRGNLFLQVESKIDAYEQTLEFVSKFPDSSGIIYCFSRKQVEEVADSLDNDGYTALPYHAGMSDQARKNNQELFIKNKAQIIVATIAFGMGIDKSNIRFIVHYDLPKNIESYYQQIGRAGRDGLQANCLLLFGYGDILKIRYFIDQKEGRERKVAEMQLEKLVAFCKSHECRRLPILKYFGENYEKNNCKMCDNCTSLEKDLTDITVPAQKFLSCVKRCNEKFGMNHIIDVLRGSKAKKILGFNHNKLTTYGIGKEYSKKQWNFIAQQLLDQELMVQDFEYGILLLTDLGWNVMKGEKLVSCKIATMSKNRTVLMEDNLQFDSELVSILKQKRTNLAYEADLPPYVIFSDKSIIEMAIYFPQSKESMLDIHGVGKYKYEKYGKIFLTIIMRYCQQNQINEKPKRARKRRLN